MPASCARAQFLSAHPFSGLDSTLASHTDCAKGAKQRSGAALRSEAQDAAPRRAHLPFTFPDVRPVRHHSLLRAPVASPLALCLATTVFF